MCSNLILDDNIGLWLSKNTKNSPLSTILLMLGLDESRRLATKNFQGKKVKIKNFELYKCYIPQKKAENMYNSDSDRKKVQFLAKENIFSNFFNFQVIFEAGKIFSTYFFSNFFIKI